MKKEIYPGTKQSHRLNTRLFIPILARSLDAGIARNSRLEQPRLSPTGVAVFVVNQADDPGEQIVTLIKSKKVIGSFA